MGVTKIGYEDSIQNIKTYATVVIAKANVGFGKRLILLLTKVVFNWPKIHSKTLLMFKMIIIVWNNCNAILRTSFSAAYKKTVLGKHSNVLIL